MGDRVCHLQREATDSSDTKETASFKEKECAETAFPSMIAVISIMKELQAIDLKEGSEVSSSDKMIESNRADNIAEAQKLKEFYRQAEKYGTESIQELKNGKIRFYRKLNLADVEGEMKGTRLVREWDPSTGAKRIWLETIEPAGNIRQV